MKIDICIWDKDSAVYGAPKRVYIMGRKWGMCIGAKSQTWSRKLGWTFNWKRLSIYPASDRLCGWVTGAKNCGRLYGHKGQHCILLWGANLYVKSD